MGDERRATEFVSTFNGTLEDFASEPDCAGTNTSLPTVAS